jgi:hypothetical protein
MPKKYPIEVRLFAVRKREEGHSWNRIADMVRENFHLDPPPSQRQMIEWVTSSSLGVVWLGTEQDDLAKLFAEAMRGKDFGILMAKWMFLQMKAVMGSQRMTIAWTEFTKGEDGNEAPKSSHLKDV